MGKRETVTKLKEDLESGGNVTTLFTILTDLSRQHRFLVNQTVSL